MRINSANVGTTKSHCILDSLKVSVFVNIYLIYNMLTLYPMW